MMLLDLCDDVLTMVVKECDLETAMKLRTTNRRFRAVVGYRIIYTMMREKEIEMIDDFTHKIFKLWKHKCGFVSVSVSEFLNIDVDEEQRYIDANANLIIDLTTRIYEQLQTKDREPYLDVMKRFLRLKRCWMSRNTKLIRRENHDVLCISRYMSELFPEFYKHFGYGERRLKLLERKIEEIQSPQTT